MTSLLTMVILLEVKVLVITMIVIIIHPPIRTTCSTTSSNITIANVCSALVGCTVQLVRVWVWTGNLSCCIIIVTVAVIVGFIKSAASTLRARSPGSTSVVADAIHFVSAAWSRWTVIVIAMPVVISIAVLTATIVHAWSVGVPVLVADAEHL